MPQIILGLLSHPAFGRRMATSGLMPVCPFKRLESVFRLTPRAFAASVTLRPHGSKHNVRKISPGWGGLCINITIPLHILGVSRRMQTRQDQPHVEANILGVQMFFSPPGPQVLGIDMAAAEQFGRFKLSPIILSTSSGFPICHWLTGVSHSRHLPSYQMFYDDAIPLETGRPAGRPDNARRYPFRPVPQYPPVGAAWRTHSGPGARDVVQRPVRDFH